VTVWPQRAAVAVVSVAPGVAPTFASVDSVVAAPPPPLPATPPEPETPEPAALAPPLAAAEG